MSSLLNNEEALEMSALVTYEEMSLRKTRDYEEESTLVNMYFIDIQPARNLHVSAPLLMNKYLILPW